MECAAAWSCKSSKVAHNFACKINLRELALDLGICTEVAFPRQNYAYLLLSCLSLKDEKKDDKI